MESYVVFRSILDKYCFSHAKFVGHDLYVSEHNFAKYLSVVTWYSISFISAYTVLTADVEDAMLCAFFWLFSIQGLVKSYVTLSGKTERKSTIDFVDNLYKANKCNNENRRILLKFVRWNLLFTKLFILVTFLTATACICIPIAIFLKTGRMEPILAAHIPFVPRDTLWGYATHCAFFIVVIVTAYAGTVANEIYLLTTTMNIWPMYKILDQAVIGLNEASGSSRKEAIKNSTWLHRRVRNIMLMHIGTYFYVKRLSRANYPIFTTELYTDQWSLIILVYVLIVLKWPPAILLFLCMLIKLFMYCSFGTAVEILNDRIYKTLINIDCVYLPPSEVKLIIFMIHQAQHPATFKAGLISLNMLTFVDVIKTTYSFSMVLLEFS